MDFSRLRELRYAEPFRPFILHLDDGRRLIVDKPYYMALSQKTGCVLVVPPNDRAVWFTPERIRDAVVLDTTNAGR